jgi:uncharacterized cupin superfamily protein
MSDVIKSGSSYPGLENLSALETELVDDQVISAIQIERQRCAEIAEARATENPGEYTSQFGFAEVCQQIAAEIRSGQDRAEAREIRAALDELAKRYGPLGVWKVITAIQGESK